MVAIVVYALCTGAALLCTVVQLRAYNETGTRLLLWSTICFACLTLNNLLLLLDRVVFPDVDLFLFRNVAALTGMAALLFGLIWEDRR
jgi:hypothetical protein